MRSTERGFTLLDTLVTIAIVGLTVLAITALHGARPPDRRAAALVLQGALAETRALAASRSGTTDVPTGATLTIVPLANGSGTRIAVFASRPLAGAPPLVADAGFPPIVLPVALELVGASPARQAFTIFVSSAGYASIAAGFAYDPSAPQSLANDPGCDEAAGTAIAVADDVATDAHPFACRGATYDADTTLPEPGASGA